MRSCVSHSAGLSRIVQVLHRVLLSARWAVNTPRLFQWHQCFDGAHLFEPQCWHLERVAHQPARRPFGRAQAEILNSSFSLSAEISWTRLSSEPTVVTASEVWVELRCVPGDLERWRRRKAQEVTSAVESAMAQVAATASGKERSGLLTSIGHFTVNSFNSASRSSMFGSTHLMARDQ